MTDWPTNGYCANRARKWGLNMQPMDTERETQRLIAEQFGLSAGVDRATRLYDLARPDVNRVADMLVILERRFECQFETREIDQIVTVADLIACLVRKAGIPERSGFW
jgi:acyl carrier protein